MSLTDTDIINLAKKMEIPLPMNVCEFQIYVNSFQVIYYEEIKNISITNKLLYFSSFIYF